jgi:hypothetical protein
MELTADDATAVRAMLSVAAGQMSEDELADWIAAHARGSTAATP